MILTVTPNLCMDKTYKIPGFTIDIVNRPSLVHTMAGGKGVNAARAYRTLGGEAIVTGFQGGLTGATLVNALHKEGMTEECVKVQGETRTCIAVINPDDGTQTEINECGPQIDAGETRELLIQFKRLVTTYPLRMVALCGSLPPGTPPNIYVEMQRIAKLHEIPCCLDSSGEPLKLGAEAGPWLLKPNRREAEYLLEKSLVSEGEVVWAVNTMLDRYGCKYAIISLGADGAIMACDKGTWHAVPPAIEFASAVASGDTMLAAFLWSILHDDGQEHPNRALRMAVGAGAANASVIGAAICTRTSMFDCAEHVTMRHLN